MRGPDIDPNDGLAAEAAEWYVRLRSENLSEIDAARFRTWLAGDPTRRREFDAIAGFWDELAVLESSPEVADARKSIAARRGAGSAASSAASPTVRRGVVGMGWWASAAAVLLAAGALWFTAPFDSDPNRYVTGTGEQRTVPLADGSVMTLNTATEIRLRYSAGLREVELMKGQASFEVAKDASRPFVVSAGGGKVRALGTVFDVYKSGDQVKVTLIEGRVAVRPASAPRANSTQADPTPAGPIQGSLQAGVGEVMLTAGQQLIYGGVSVAPKPAAADLQRATAWRARKLDFSDTPLHEAIAEANRYSQDQILLHAPRLLNARISGKFEAGKNEAFAEGLQAYFRLDVERRADHSIVLTPRD